MTKSRALSFVVAFSTVDLSPPASASRQWRTTFGAHTGHLWIYQYPRELTLRLPPIAMRS
jgi:hypothetical protein